MWLWRRAGSGWAPGAADARHPPPDQNPCGAKVLPHRRFIGSNANPKRPGLRPIGGSPRRLARCRDVGSEGAASLAWRRRCAPLLGNGPAPSGAAPSSAAHTLPRLRRACPAASQAPNLGGCLAASLIGCQPASPAASVSLAFSWRERRAGWMHPGCLPWFPPRPGRVSQRLVSNCRAAGDGIDIGASWARLLGAPANRPSSPQWSPSEVAPA